MKKEIQHLERRGLPGGPNETFTYTTGVFSTEGFRMDSPDVNNYQNIIPSGSISMKERDGSPLRKGPIHGVDNLGNEQVMYPGYNYQFPGTEVTETLLAQTGYEVPKRRGVRLNYDDKGNVVSESTHIMATETDGKGNWFSFPTLFQNSIPYADDSKNWVDMSDRPWEEAYEEAKKRNEVIEFGKDKEAAIKFGEGSWKPKMKLGGGLLDKTIKCGNCGWEWKAADGGSDVMDCHKCGGEGLVKAQNGGESKPGPLMIAYNRLPKEKKMGGAIVNKKEFGGQLIPNKEIDKKNIAMYKDYIKGNIGNDDVVLKNYDKLNRIYYTKAKELGMTVTNYVMTYVVDNS
jgi:hypothetical protein